MFVKKTKGYNTTKKNIKVQRDIQPPRDRRVMLFTGREFWICAKPYCLLFITEQQPNNNQVQIYNKHNNKQSVTTVKNIYTSNR
jgi:hypothetical protein